LLFNSKWSPLNSIICGIHSKILLKDLGTISKINFKQLASSYCIWGTPNLIHIRSNYLHFRVSPKVLHWCLVTIMPYRGAWVHHYYSFRVIWTILHGWKKDQISSLIDQFWVNKIKIWRRKIIQSAAVEKII